MRPVCAARTSAWIASVVLGLSVLLFAAPRPAPVPQQIGAAATPLAKYLGSVKAIHGGSITLTPDGAPDVEVALQNAKIVRIAPGEKDLKNAVPSTLQDLQVGDRVLVRGKLSDDGKSVTAAAVVVMKKTDVETKQQREREDWQKRGIGGLVSAVDTGGDITITNTVAGVKKTTVIHSSKATVVRRYAPDSVKFDDAKPGSLTDIQAGNQLRARGTRSADGSEFTAEEIVSGAFRNIAGVVNSVDAATNSITVQDLVLKKPTVVKVGADSQLRKLPPEMAQRIAMRLKGNGGTPGAPGGSAPPVATQAPPGPPAGGMPGGGGGGQWRAGGGGDLQQMLGRLPAATLADLHKGEAVMIVATEGSASGAVTAITLLGGVEPILAANGGQPMTLSPWSLSGGAGGEDAGQ